MDDSQEWERMVQSSIAMVKRERILYQAAKEDPRLLEKARNSSKEHEKRRVRDVRLLLRKLSHEERNYTLLRNKSTSSTDLIGAARRAMMRIDVEDDFLFTQELPVTIEERLIFPDEKNSQRLSTAAIRAVEDAFCGLCDRVLIPELERWDSDGFLIINKTLTEHDHMSTKFFKDMLNQIFHTFHLRHQHIESHLQQNKVLHSSIQALKLECNRRKKELTNAQAVISTLQAQVRDTRMELASVQHERDDLKRQLDQAWRVLDNSKKI